MNPSATLTSLELNLVKDLADGYEYKEIAARRNRSPYTIENQARKIKEKTETRNIAQLVSWYYITKYRILISLFFLALTTASLLNDTPLVRTTRTVKTCRTSKTKRNDYEIEI